MGFVPVADVRKRLSAVVAALHRDRRDVRSQRLRRWRDPRWVRLGAGQHSPVAPLIVGAAPVCTATADGRAGTAVRRSRLQPIREVASAAAGQRAPTPARSQAASAPPPASGRAGRRASAARKTRARHPARSTGSCPCCRLPGAAASSRASRAGERRGSTPTGRPTRARPLSRQAARSRCCRRQGVGRTRRRTATPQRARRRWCWSSTREVSRPVSLAGSASRRTLRERVHRQRRRVAGAGGSQSLGVSGDKRAA